MTKKLLITCSMFIIVSLIIVQFIRFNTNQTNNKLDLVRLSNDDYPIYDELNPDKNQYTLIAEKNGLKFYFNAKEVDFYLESPTGKKWYSNPEDRDDDDYAKGRYKKELNSNILVSYSEIGLTQDENAQSSGDAKDPTFYKIENGVRIVYFFEKMGFTIPVNYYLTDDGFLAEVDTVNIIEETALVESKQVKDPDNPGKMKTIHIYKDYYIKEIAILPYFSAGNSLDEGYVVIPDGSGALINYSTDKASYPDYKRFVYARDRAENQMSLKMNNQNISLPIFGIKNNDNGLLAVVEEGDEFAYLNAKAAGRDTGYSTAFFSFAFRQSEDVRFLEQNFISKVVPIMHEEEYPGDKIQVKYYFLEDDKSDYVGIAHKYRELLGLERSQLSEVSLFVELYGATVVKRSFLGIPVDRTIELTTFDQVKEMADDFNSYADHLIIKYTGWNRDGLKNTKLPIDAKQNGKLGSRNEYKEMISYLENKEIEYYANVDLINFYDNGNGIYKFFHATRAISKGPSLQHKFLLSTTRRNSNERPGYLISPHKFDDVIGKFYDNYERRYDDNKIALDTFGSELYSNFGRKNTRRDVSKDFQIQAIEHLKANGGQLSLTNPNAYLIPYVDHVFGVPTNSSQYNIFHLTIPFYQIVFAGSVEYSVPAINQSDSPEELFLQAIETGGNLSFSLFYKNAYELKETDANDLNNSEYFVWKDDIKRYYQEYKQVKELILNQFIAEHEMVEQNCFKTTYENGYSIVVNYNTDIDVLVNGVTIPAYDYRVFQNNELVILQGE